MYAYEFTLCRRAVVVTMDLSAKNLHMFTSDHWVSNAKNVVLLRLGAPAWVSDSIAHAPPNAAMAAWAVEEVAAWLEGMDMVGPAAYFRAQGVNGADLLAFRSVQQSSRDLGTTSFVARKVLALRDAHVSAGA